MLERVYGKLRHLVESLIAILLFSLQQIPVVFTWTWPMLYPLAAYFTWMLWVNDKASPLQIHILFFEQRLMPGRVINVIGFTLFLIAPSVSPTLLAIETYFILAFSLSMESISESTLSMNGD